MKKSNLLKKAVSVLLVASALAGCGSSASQTATTAAPAAAGTETSEAATEAASSESSAEPWHHYHGNGFCMGLHYPI